MVGGGSGEEERGLRSLRLSSENRDCYSKKGAISVRGLPWLSGREFRVNAWAEGEGCRDDGAANGRREGEREGRPIKEGFFRRRVAVDVIAPRRRVGCVLITLFNEIRFQRFQESWLTHHQAEHRSLQKVV